MDVTTLQTLAGMFSVTTAVSFIGLSQAIACALWTVWDPLFKHPLCRVPFIAGFIAFSCMTITSVMPDLGGLEFTVCLATAIFLVIGGTLHQKAATRVMLSKASKVSRYQFLITETVLLGYLASIGVVMYVLFQHNFSVIP